MKCCHLVVLSARSCVLDACTVVWIPHLYPVVGCTISIELLWVVFLCSAAASAQQQALYFGFECMYTSCVVCSCHHAWLVLWQVCVVIKSMPFAGDLQVLIMAV